jgi:beta-glucosidase
MELGGEGRLGVLRNLKLIAPGPVAALQAQFPDAQILYDPGEFPRQAALLARRADLVVLNGIRFESEGFDAPDMSLPNGQDAVFEAVLAANPNSIVILQTGNPVALPWHKKARAIVQGWYQGQSGATALAEIIAGKVNPSGRLPLTWYASVVQTPHRRAWHGCGRCIGECQCNTHRPNLRTLTLSPTEAGVRCRPGQYGD